MATNAWLTLRQGGRCLQGLMILIWAANQLDLVWASWRLALVLAAVVGGILLFVGIFLIQAAITFWTVQSLEVYNIFTYGGETAAQYPVTFYENWMRQVLIWLLPVACITYFPVCAITGHPEELGSPFWWQCSAPAVGLVALILGLLAWRFGLRYYTSTGT